MDKKITGIAAGVAAVGAAASFITGSLLNEDIEVTGRYYIRPVNEYVSNLIIDVPEEFTPDIVTLKVNDLKLSDTLLPYGSFEVNPIFVKDMQYLNLEMYVRGEEAGTATFDDKGNIIIKAKKKFVNTDEEETMSPAPTITVIPTETASPQDFSNGLITEIPKQVSDDTEDKETPTITEITNEQEGETKNVE